MSLFDYQSGPSPSEFLPVKSRFALALMLRHCPVCLASPRFCQEKEGLVESKLPKMSVFATLSRKVCQAGGLFLMLISFWRLLHPHTPQHLFPTYF
jgi:hypothetical protein